MCLPWGRDVQRWVDLREGHLPRETSGNGSPRAERLGNTTAKHQPRSTSHAPLSA